MGMIGPILSGIGSAVSVVGTIMKGNQEADMMEHQAKVSERQADIERDAGAYKQNLMKRQRDRLHGRAVAASAQSGTNPFKGSPGQATIALLTESNLDEDATRYSTEKRAGDYKTQAGIHQFSADQRRAAIPMQVAGGLLRSARRFTLNPSFV